MSRNKSKRWKTKEIFIEWVKKQIDKASKECKKYADDLDKDNIKYCDSIGSMACLNASVHLTIFEDIVDDRVLEHFNNIEYMEGVDTFYIDLVYLEFFLTTVEAVDFFEKSRLNTSSKGIKFKDKIGILKQEADAMQYYSKEQIEIRLPIQPHVLIYTMVDNFKRHSMSEDLIKSFMEYFGKHKIQRISDAYKERQKEWNVVSLDTEETSIQLMRTMKTKMHYYKPKK